MEGISEAAEGLKKLAARFGPVLFFEATVKAVDREEYTADLETEEGLQLFECRLRAVAGGSQSIDVLPKVGTTVLIGKMADDDYLIIACDEIDNYRVTVGPTVLELTSNGVTINGGSLGGLVKAQTLAAELNKTNALVNAIKTVLTSWVVVGGDGGAALLAAAQLALQPLSTGSFGPNIENEKVKH